MKQKFLPRFATAAIMSALLLCLSFSARPDSPNPVPLPGNEGSGEREMKALVMAYPDRISQATSRDGDWAVKVDGEWFFWAHARLLPESERTQWQSYEPGWKLNPYPVAGLLRIPELDSQTEARLKEMLKQERAKPPSKSPDFLNRLYSGGSRKEADSQQVTVDFLGFSVTIHKRIATALQNVDKEITRLRDTDPQVASFVASLDSIEGFNYRDVYGTRYRSYHSYGLAVDLVPREYDGKAVYWRWSWVLDRSGQWWATPYARRWMIPLPIVSAFEKNGFVWGGKWLFFDNMHFEYRPEILNLARQQQYNF